MQENANKVRDRKLHEIKKYNAGVYKRFEKNKKRKVQKTEYTATISNSDNLMEIDNLHTYFYTDVGTVRAVNGASITIPRGKTVGIVGESGCGKSVCSLSILRLLQEPQGQITDGQIRFDTGKEVVDLTKVSQKYMNDIRGNKISMIFQEPMTTLNPVFSIGKQIDEIYYYHNEEKLTRKQMMEHSIKMLETVGIANAAGVYKMYPHELSGGMRQRVVIAMAIACNPKLIIADEPTTALDVTIQAQILDLFKILKEKISASIMLITHDLGVVAETADYVSVMYAGRVVEQGTVHDVFHNPSHPYTIGLMKSRPTSIRGDDRLFAIPGSVPNPIELPDYCYFRNRCDSCVKACAGAYPSMISLSPTHSVACYRYLNQNSKEGL